MARLSMNRPLRVVLTGFSGTGKTAVAELVAAKLRWQAVDTDSLIERAAGRSILDIFAREGEPRFRELESEALRDACRHQRAVVSTGGGAVLRPENRRLMADGGFVVCLEARPETIKERLLREGSEPLERPLLANGDWLARVRSLKRARQHLYALCDYTVHADGLTPEQVADEVARAWHNCEKGGTLDRERFDVAVPEGAAAVVSASTGDYPIVVQWGALASLGARLRDAGLAHHVYLITDEQVAHHHGDDVEAALQSAGIDFDVFPIPPGEASKTLTTASSVYDWLLDRKAERGHTIVAVGGGVVTDLGGYVAATFARGLPLIHVPTSLLGMVDAAIGGKVAVNHPKAKNMIGTFYHPQMVLADPALLRTLPPREMSGWAEAIKHALIADEGYLRFFEENADGILKLEPEVTTEAISRSAVIKAAIVSEDERETTGRRSLLNYGHTLAHAIESTTGYQRFRHGEADGIGMTAAAAISARMGLLEPAVAARQRAVLERYNLPTRVDGLDRGQLTAAMALDKKVQGKTVRWVLLEGIGKPVLRDGVPPDVVDAALGEVLI